jgi:antitoxin VapB
MIHLSRETEALAIRLATAQRVSVDAAIQRALKEQACIVAIEPQAGARRRMSVQEMLAVGSEIAALPVLDPRSPHEIMNDLNAP